MQEPGAPDPLASAVDQLRLYSNQRRAAGEVDHNEGNERLFHTNQFLVATCFDEARVGTLSAGLKHYLEWKDTAPVPLADVAAELHLAPPTPLSSQQKLVAGLLRPAHLIDILRHFTLYQQESGRTVKVLCRYQQFRAVHAAVHRLRHGKTRRQDGEHDRRGGLIWHTQGSGKSLTMVFLIRKLRSLPELRRFKAVVVTDRNDLQVQLSNTAALTGETVQVASDTESLQKLLKQKGPGLVFATIQKYALRDEEESSSGKPEASRFPVLNEDESLLVLVDEAHRSHTSALHANLLQSLPNSARIGFTGTPILMGDKKRTHEIFGEYLDRYTLRESEADGATVPILYEGRNAEGAVRDGGDLDQLFEDWFSEYSEAEREAIKRRYGSKAEVLEARELIEAKARDMLRHYVAHLLPNGLKAQVVAYSRLAAVRYTEALAKARDALVAEAEALSTEERGLDELALVDRPRRLAAAVRAWRQLPVLRRLEFAAVISGTNHDDPSWREWTDSEKAEARIERFKKALVHEDETKADPLAFLVVKSMLLTGFDAPVEGVIYLDRSIREAELLQTIARVNRTGYGKTAGLLVDYANVARNLKEALAAYSAEDVAGVMRGLSDELPILRDRHQRLVNLFSSRGVDFRGPDEPCLQLLGEARLRAEFNVKLKQFLELLELVLPRPEALPYVRDSRRLSFLYVRARKRYRDGTPELDKSVGAKVRKLIDEHIVSLGVDPKVAPLSITDPRFAAQVEREVSPRARASEMEHAIRFHIREHMDEDPVHYQKLSERLEELLRAHGESWEQLALALKDFLPEVHGGRQRDTSGLDPRTEAPFFAVLEEERKKHQPVDEPGARWLAELTVRLVALLRTELSVVGFWKNAQLQAELGGKLFMFLDDQEVVPFERVEAVRDRLMELAKSNHEKLVGG